MIFFYSNVIPWGFLSSVGDTLVAGRKTVEKIG
jgi:hypothetical protein